MITIISAHPWSGSFNKVIVNTLTEKLEKKNLGYQVIDLYKDSFNPVLSEKELELYSKGEFLDPLVGKYQDIIKKTSKIVFVFPIWWNGAPAILKGLFDKVFLKNFAFNNSNGWTPLLNINESYLITTSEVPTQVFIHQAGDPINDFITGSLQSSGIKNTIWMNCDSISTISNEKRKEFLKKIESIF